jgi:hypothetical protein
MMSKSPLTRFEDFARELVEGSVDRLLGEQLILVEVAGKLASAAERSRQDDLLANRYTIRLHPSTFSQLMLQTPDTANILEALLVRLAAEGQMVLAGDALLDFVADETVAQGKAMVTADFTAAKDEPTAVLIRRKSPTAQFEKIDAYLIVNGRRHVALDRAVTSVGRSLENDIVLEDPGVSRKHAQLRWRSDRFVIFDLGSRAGTIVNDRTVREQDLNSGDVIKLGSAAIIFGEEAGDAESDEASRLASDGITQELSRDDLP